MQHESSIWEPEQNKTRCGVEVEFDAEDDRSKHRVDSSQIEMVAAQEIVAVN